MVDDRKNGSEQGHQEPQPANLDLEHSNGKNKFDVMYHAIDAIYNVITFKHLAYFIIFIIGSCALVLAYKSTVSEFFEPWDNFVAFLNDSLNGNLWAIVATVLLCISITGNFLQRYFYKKEINRLSKRRKKLIHKMKTGEYKTLTIHNSSETEQLQNQVNDILNEEKE